MGVVCSTDGVVYGGVDGVDGVDGGVAQMALDNCFTNNLSSRSSTPGAAPPKLKFHPRHRHSIYRPLSGETMTNSTAKFNQKQV